MKNMLAARSHFSIGESMLKPGDLVNKAQSAGFEAVGLVDTMTVSGMVDLSKEAKKAGIKAIVGCRLRIVDEPLDKTPKKKRTKPNFEWYPKVYVRNAEGMKDLIALLSIAHQDDHFYYVPRLGFDELLDALSKGNLAFSSGDFYSVLHHEQYADIMQQIWRVCDVSQTFIELVPIDTPLFYSLNKKAIELSREHNAPLLLTYPAFYADDDDAATLEVLGAIAGKAKMTDPWLSRQYVQDFSVGAPGALLGRAAAARRAMDNIYGDGFCGKSWLDALSGTQQLVDLCDYTWGKQDVTLPKMADNELTALIAEIKKGWAERLTKPMLGYQPTSADLPKYKERLSYELGVLKKMGFERYFLLVQDLVNWSKKSGIIVGPGRGSVGGSLIAYLLGITDVDPLRFNLIFERFINPDRLDLPDADLDFMSTRRHEVIDYLTERYGETKVAGISNYTTMASSSALRDVGRVHNIAQSDLRCTTFVPKEHGKPVSLNEAAEQVPELAAFKDTYGAVWKHATRLEGVMRSLGQHAAGIVVAGEDIVNRAVVQTRNESAVVNWDKRVVEDWGLVKMDILGLSTLDVLAQAIRLIKERHRLDIDLTALPLDDPETMKGFGKGDTVGVFQFESGGMRKLLKDLAEGGELTFDDLAAATSLYRPGPMDSGLLDDYVAIKQGMKLPYYEHPNMEPALSSTSSVIIYQEQVMQLARDLAGFSMTDADHLRKAMGKKDKDKMAKMREQWVEGCKTHSGLKEKAATELFDKIEKFAGYGFNRSHAVEYSIISYWTMYLKTHYAAEFYAASMSVIKEEKLPTLVSDAQERNIYVVPPDINRSEGEFAISYDAARDQHLLLTPFNRLKGLSDNTTRAILDARVKKGGAFASKEDFLTHVNKTKCNKRHQAVLDEVGAFAEIEPGQLPARHPDRLKRQLELMPGLIVEHVKAERAIDRGKHTMGLLAQIVAETRSCEGCDLAGGVHPTPSMGKSPKFMVVADCPNWAEERAHKLLQGDASNYLKSAIRAAGLSINDGYFTTLVKSPKSDKQLTTEQINACSGFLKREVELMKPPVIITLGGASLRYFLPGVKGSIMDLSGTVTYLPEHDASVVAGINPGMIAFEASRMAQLEETFKKAAELVL